jgi:hypothetical protein
VKKKRKEKKRKISRYVRIYEIWRKKKEREE